MDDGQLKALNDALLNSRDAIDLEQLLEELVPRIGVQ
jgi:hypothetical protein